jgi:hypothetical protein
MHAQDLEPPILIGQSNLNLDFHPTWPATKYTTKPKPNVALQRNNIFDFMWMPIPEPFNRQLSRCTTIML